MKKTMRKNFVRVVAFLLMACLILPIAAYAETIGYTRKTDIVTYINDYLIPSFSYNDKMMVFVEELENYGFQVEGGPSSGTPYYIDVFTGYYNGETYVPASKSMKIADVPDGESYDGKIIRRMRYDLGSEQYEVTKAYWTVYINNESVESVYIYRPHLGGGYAIYVSDLYRCGDITWEPGAKAAKVWIHSKYFNPKCVIPELETKFDFNLAFEYLKNEKQKYVSAIPAGDVITASEVRKNEGVKYIDLYLKDYIFGFIFVYRVYEDGYVENTGEVLYEN